MGMTRIYKSNRLENLVDRLASVTLKSPLSSPFQVEQIIVQTQGMAQWLKLELSRRQGMVANVEFPFSRAFLYKLMEKVLPEKPCPIEPAALTWRIMGTLETCLEKPFFSKVKTYLASSTDPRRLFQLAERIANLFDQYSVYRPEWIEAWLPGQETHEDSAHWQAELWRATLTDGLACQGKFLYDLIQALQQPGLDEALLPERLSIFGATSLPPMYLKVFEALGKRLPVDLFLLSPCSEHWGDITTAREEVRIQAKTGDGTLDAKALCLDRGHPLLASWGKTGRDFHNLILENDSIEDEERDDYRAPAVKNLLGFLQSGVLKLEDEAAASTAIEVRRDDRSVQIHACHSPLRELQVLRDHLLDWLAADSTLSAGDILVMLPDVEAYAPFVKGVFGTMETGAPAIPYTLVDRGARQQSPLVDAFVMLLRLHGSRLTSTVVTAFFETAAVRRRFGVDEGDLAQIRQWLQNAGIRWGRNAAHRSQLGLPSFAEHSWEHGRDRLLLGYAMADDTEALVSDLLPCEGIEGTTTDILGRWLDFQRRLFATLEDFTGDRTLSDWAGALNQAFDTLFLPEKEEETAANHIRQVLDCLRQQQEASRFEKKLPLPVILERIVPLFEEPPVGKAFLRGAVTFTGLNPMRGIPFRFICILGMQDGAFPRCPASLTFDLMAQKPKLGDASRREDDRYLFLETLLSARDCLYISYIGQSVRDNSPRPPSVVVSELQDYIAARGRLQKPTGEQKEGAEEPSIVEQLLVTRHRLHAFSPAYFREGTDRRLFSYSPASAKISQSLVSRAERCPAGSFLATPLPELGEEWNPLALKDLQSFFRNPAKFFVNHRLEFKLPEDKELLQDEEPFELNKLQEFQRKQEALESALDGRNQPNLLPLWKGRGQLPPGAVGTILGNDLIAATGPMLEKIKRVIGPARKVQFGVDLSIAGFKLEGQLEAYEGVGLVNYRPAAVSLDKKPDAHLNLWIGHLALCLSGWNGPMQSYLIGEDANCELTKVADAGKILEGLLDIYRQGLRQPLRFFPKSSFAYAKAIYDNCPEDEAWQKAKAAWIGSQFENGSPGESEDAYFRLCFGNDQDVFNDQFKALAALIFNPLLKHQFGQMQKPHDL